MATTLDLNQHYRQLLQLPESWGVMEVILDVTGRRVEICLEHQRGVRLTCPECGQSCTVADHAPERTWRHLDTMQYETVLRARLPRADCKTCGAKTLEAPWAGKHSPFTWLFETFAVAVLQAASSISDACELLRIGWDGAQRLMERAVTRGLARRDTTGLQHLGIDEKSFRRGQSYLSALNDLDESRVLEVVEGRTTEKAVELLESLPPQERENITAVAVDMWEAYLSACRTVLPQADIVHDKYHVSAYLNKAVDAVRRDEHKRLMGGGDDTLKGTKYEWMRTHADKRSSEAVAFRALHQMDLKTSRAWHYKETFRHLWEYDYMGAAGRFYREWRASVMRSHLEPLKKVARLLDAHLPEVLNYIKHKITNAVSEGLNSRIQAIKSAARGFRSFHNYRIRILFHCGKLALAPSVTP